MCQIRIPGICNHDPETTVLAHLNGSGIAAKHLSIHGSYACSNCHGVVDGRVPYDPLPPYRVSQVEIKKMHLEGVIRTQIIMVRDGVLIL